MCSTIDDNWFETMGTFQFSPNNFSPITLFSIVCLVFVQKATEFTANFINV